MALRPVLEPGEGQELRHVAGAHDHQVGLDLRDLGKQLFSLAGIASGIGEARPFRRIAGDDDGAAVFRRRQLGLHLREQPAAGNADTQRQEQHQPANAQRAGQHGAVAALQPVEEALDQPSEDVAALGMLQELRAHHRRQREGHEARDDDRPRQRHREFEEQAPGAPRREGDGGIDGGQRQRHGDDREADLVGALDRRVEGLHALLDVAVDVFEHHDGVIHHEADGQHHGKQGERVHREARRIHDGEGGDQRYRDRHDGDHRGAEGMQEQQDDQQHQADGFKDGVEHVLDRAVDKHRRIIGDRDRGAPGQLAVEARQQRLQLAGYVQRIGHRRLDDADGDRRRTLVAALAAHVRRAEFDAGHVAQPHLKAAAFLQHDVAEFIRRAEPGLGQHGELAVGTLDAARRNFGILVADRGLDILHGEALAGEPGGIDPHPHGIGAGTIDRGIRHAVEVLEAVDDVALGIVGQCGGIHRVRLHDEIDDRLRVGLHLGDVGFGDLAGQLAPDPAHPVAHVARCGIDVDAGAKGDGDAALLGARGGFQRVDALDAGERAFEDLRHLRFDDLGGGAGIVGLHRDLRLVDVGIFTHREAREGHEAGEQQHQAQHGGENRASDAEFGETHRRYSAAAVETTSTLAPLDSCALPAVTTVSPALRPSTTSTLPSMRLPSFTFTSVTLSSATV